MGWSRVLIRLTAAGFALQLGWYTVTVPGRWFPLTAYLVLGDALWSATGPRYRPERRPGPDSDGPVLAMRPER